MDGLTSSSPLKALGTGAVLGAGNPKNLIVGAAAAATVASTSLSVGQQIAAVAVYAVIAILGVAAPIVVMVALGGRAHEVLEGWRAWLGQHNAAVMSVLSWSSAWC